MKLKPQVHAHLFESKPVFAGLLLCVVCLISGIFSKSYAQDRTISLSNGCALPGATSQVEISLSKVEDIAGCDLSIAFEPDVLSILDVNTTSLTQDFLLSYAASTPGLLRISMANVEGLSTQGPGVVAVITVKMSTEQPVGTRTALWFKDARWYNELSIRQTLIGDNAVIEVGSSTPVEDGGVVFSLDPTHGQPGNTISAGLWLSLPAGVGYAGGILTYDATMLQSPLLAGTPALAGWTQQIVYSSGQIHFIFSGTTELNNPYPIQIASCTWTLSPGAVPGATSVIAVSDPHATNLDDFGYLCWGATNTVMVDAPEPTPTPTETITPTATELFLPATATPTPTGTDTSPPEMTLTVTKTPLSATATITPTITSTPEILRVSGWELY